MEVDLYRHLPHDATLHVGRMHLADVATAEEEMVDRFVIPAANALAQVLPHMVVFDCGEAATSRSADYECRLGERIGELTGAATIGVGAAVVQALHEVRASRVAIVSPYGHDMNRQLRAAIEAEGLTVTAVHGMGLSSCESAAIDPDALYHFVQSSIGPRVPGDALLLAGTNFPAMRSLSLLKIPYHVPIVTANLAVLQAVKRELEGLRQRELVRLSS
jgi:maleate isomerase